MMRLLLMTVKMAREHYWIGHRGRSGMCSLKGSTICHMLEALRSDPWCAACSTDRPWRSAG